MIAVSRRRGIGLIVMTCFITQLGCARSMPPLPSEEIRAQLGTIGLVSARFTPEAELQVFARGPVAGAAKAAAIGILGTLGTLVILPFALLAPPPPGSFPDPVALAREAAREAVPAEKAEEIEATIRNSLAALKIQEGMRDRVLQLAQEQSEHRFVLLTAQGPATPDEMVSYRPPPAEEIDSVLEISVLTLALKSQGGGDDPFLTLFMSVRARLIRVSDGAELYARTLDERLGTTRFTELAANNAQAFREDMDYAYQRLGERIVDLFFPLR